jgi:hypothetical protein
MAIPPVCVDNWFTGNIALNEELWRNVGLFLVGTEHVQMGITAFYQPMV